MVIEPASRIPEDVGDFLVQPAPGTEFSQIGGRPCRTADQRAGIVDQRRVFEDGQLRRADPMPMPSKRA